MGNETVTGNTEDHEGERYLRLIGLGHLAGRKITRKDGTSMVVRDFLDDENCARYARPAFMGLAAMDADDPEYQLAVSGLRESISGLVGIDLAAEA